MNEHLELMQWREFVVGEIFEVKATKNGIDKNKLNGKKGKFPYITRTENQNGIDDFIAEQENYLKNESNVIIIGLDTQTAFYHNSEFYTGQNIQILKNTNLNKHNALFMIQALKNLMTKFNWGGNGATLTRLKRGKILLPIDSKGEPNYTFMESFMRDLESKHLQKILAYYTHKLEVIGGKLNPLYRSQASSYCLKSYFDSSSSCHSERSKESFKDSKRTLNQPQNNDFVAFLEGSLMEITKNELGLESVQWGEFVVGEIFDFVIRGKRLIERDRIKGNIPYYSASKEGNGLTDMIANPLFIAKNKLIISTFCDCYYVEGEFTASDEITIFGNDKLNKHNGLFIARIVKSNASKYAFGRKAFSERLMKQVVLLPIDSKGEPNYTFMESYMKALEAEHLEKIIAYYNAKLTKLNNAVQ
ncbi:restriction endonuclease subunit S [Helicobacter mustelae]|uniref:Putative type II restriction enzyme n=1 Tax=Helicobacter mustelae (strain ATCC 43772 / CCUG 25715 / CIP 103759 / LMG 18044 / NCTC 12198 / R85-136P) TaxID=679897 RepID=D3UH05_HELM1|nr:restriction endonuclease subunit S [Helicobacter mustelae]CBG39777.1 Putative type II restriction enzyme [Helicobacter mustelae 12198]SQH71287.1 type II restriction enzyme [Helicobacter mustelae]